MPLEVRQIGIRLRIGDEGQPEPGAASRRRSSALDLLRTSDPAVNQARLVEQCVDAVLAELARRREP